MLWGFVVSFDDGITADRAVARRDDQRLFGAVYGYYSVALPQYVAAERATGAAPQKHAGLFIRAPDERYFADGAASGFGHFFGSATLRAIAANAAEARAS